MPARARPADRRGIATLEFVLVFPFLLALVSALFLVARADTRKALTATAARNDAWDRRATADPGRVLGLGDDPAASQVTATAAREVERGPLFPRDTFTARTRVTATGRTWDHRDVKFRPGRGFLVPHLDELVLIARGATDLAGIMNNLTTFVSLAARWAARP